MQAAARSLAIVNVGDLHAPRSRLSKFPQEGKMYAEDQLPLGCGVAFAELAALTADCGGSTPPWSVLPCVPRATMGLHLLFFFLCLFLLSAFILCIFFGSFGHLSFTRFALTKKTHGVTCARGHFFRDT